MSSNASVPAGGTEQDQPEPFRATSVGPSLTVKDIRSSVAWYRDVVGFTVHQEYEREGKLIAVALSAGDVRILITQDNGARGSDRVKGEGFSLRFTTKQNVDAIAKRIVERGGVLESEPADVWGQRAFRLKDPDGFRMVISSER
ncbi:MAG TPA: VOC family protein [Gemmatimonadaceae bacterium]|nr:VOC family protein [Gemmatimonadaceae bacterium]